MKDDSDLAFKALETISKTPSEEQTRLLNSLPTRAAIQQLFLGPYWKRLWIIQEVSVSVNVMMYCGKASMMWDTLVLALDNIIGLKKKNAVARFRVA